MEKNATMRMSEFIIGSLIRQNFNVFRACISDQGSDLIVRNIASDSTPQYIEVQLLSRTNEYDNELIIPIVTNPTQGHFCYIILFSSGMRKIWLLRADELIALRKEGLDARDTSPYLVNDFDRLKYPELGLTEYNNK